MKKLFISISILLSAFFVLQSQTLEIDATIYSVDTLENHQVGPGTQYVSMRLTATGKRLDVFFLKTDLKNPNIEIRAALGQDSIYRGETVSSVAKRKSIEGAFYFAGTNGDFYETAGDYIGYPTAGSMVNSEIAKIPNNRKIFAIDEQNFPEIGVMDYDGAVQYGSSTWKINSVNHLRGENKLVLYNQHNGKYTRTNEHGTEVLVELLNGHTWATNKTLKAKVVKIEKGVGRMAIPKGQAVLSGHGSAAANLDQLSENDEIDIRLNLSVNSNASSYFTQMTGGDPRAVMLLEGVVENGDIWNELHPRTGLGYSLNRDTLIFCIVDGRSVSVGATTKQLAEIMKTAGAYTAFNMDGGGSSSMYIAEYGGPVNKTSDGNERAVSNSIFIVSTAPNDNNISNIKPYKASVALPLYGEFIPQFYGYNQYGVLLNSDVQGVVLSCPESLGRIDGNKFIATGDTPGKITATYNGNVTTSINVSFLPVSEIKIRLDSVIVDSRTDYPIEVLATTAAGSSLVSPDALNWEVENTDICKIEKGIIKAIKNGTTKVTGEINDVSDEIKVKIEIPKASTIIGDSLQSEKWSLSASSFLNAALNVENLPNNWDHGSAVNFVHAAGRSPYVTLTNKNPFYGLPDTMKIIVNMGDVAMTEVIVSLRANNATQSVSSTLKSFKNNEDFSLDIPLDELFDLSDKAVYPIWFDNVKFYISASEMTAGKAYTLAVKDILLVYKDLVVSSVSTVKSERFQVYPNPLRGQTLYIQLKENKSQKVRTEIYNLSGQLMDSKQHGDYKGALIMLPVEKLLPGSYLLKVYEDDLFDTAKFIVQ